MAQNTSRAFLLFASSVKKQTSSGSSLQVEGQDAAITNQPWAQHCLPTYANMKYLTTVSATCWKNSLLAALVVTHF